METNMNPKANKELWEKGQNLIKAAYEFWKIHQKLNGPRAVVWLKSDDGYFILFTRGEYKNQIMHNISPISEEIEMIDPFIKTS